MNETEIAEESGKTHDYTQEWVYLGIRKDGKALLNRGHALMHMITWKYIIIAHTKASLEGIPPKNIKTDIIWKRIMSRLITRIHAIQHKTERARIKREAKQEGFSHYNTNKNRTTGTNERNSRLAPQDRGGTHKTEPGKTSEPRKQIETI